MNDPKKELVAKKETDNARSIVIDFLKGISIIAVVFYHFDAKILPYGYLGVDIFFVVGGYLMLRTIYNKLQHNSFSFWSFFLQKVIRLWPLILLASVFSMFAGFFLMLPDDYENLAESVIASSVFSNNILLCITTKNYWNVANQYKPLMHLWYIGVLMQCYFILPVIYVLFLKRKSNSLPFKKHFFVLTSIIFTISLILFLLPFPSFIKFYILPFRLFELTVGGGLLLITPTKPLTLQKKIAAFVLLIFIVVLLGTRKCIISPQFMLLAITASTTALLALTKDITLERKNMFFHLLNPICLAGKSSYSIYIWHQVLIAFCFYAFFQDKNLLSFICFLIASVSISLLSYWCFERPLFSIICAPRKRILVLSCSVFMMLMICFVALFVYLKAGVVRDIPELDIKKSNVHRHMHAEYCDRPYQWDKDFNPSDKLKILVIGNSFGRDWANILYEYDSTLVISYIFGGASDTNAIRNNTARIKDADIVFYATGPEFIQVPDDLLEILSGKKYYIIGNKNFGGSNGIIYFHRFLNDYHSQTVAVSNELIKYNEQLEQLFGSHFIDILKPVLQKDGRVKVFTDDNKFISQDCFHLTQAGCKYFARVLDIASMLR